MSLDSLGINIPGEDGIVAFGHIDEVWAAKERKCKRNETKIKIIHGKSLISTAILRIPPNKPETIYWGNSICWEGR